MIRSFVDTFTPCGPFDFSWTVLSVVDGLICCQEDYHSEPVSSIVNDPAQSNQFGAAGSPVMRLIAQSLLGDASVFRDPSDCIVGKNWLVKVFQDGRISASRSGRWERFTIWTKCGRGSIEPTEGMIII
jgi:hypothetical protein